MKTTRIILLSGFFFSLLAPLDTTAQHSYIRGKIRENVRQNIEKDQEEKHRTRGREELRKISYENDTRYPNPQNKIQATIEMEITTYDKRGNSKEKIKSMLAFGKTGECMVTNMGQKDEMRIVYDYAGKATYMINVKEKSATKMPIMNITKMAKSMAKNQVPKDENVGMWKLTDERATISGYECRKHEYIDKDGTKMDVWVTKDISLDLSDNFLFGAQIKSFGDPQNVGKIDKNLPNGLMVKSISYDKKSGHPSSKTEITNFKKSSDSQLFDLSEYKVIDILDGL